MVWSIDGKQGNEFFKVRWEVVPYTRGVGLDIGCGPDKLFPHFIGVDNGHHEVFGYKIKPDVRVKSAADLSIFSSQSMDFCASSHLLEHFPEDEVDGILNEWWRLIKIGGYLVLYLPDKTLYPHIGEKGCNPDHHWEPEYDSVVKHMDSIKTGWDLVLYQLRDQDDEYSGLYVFRKLS